jgi:hypothetical protein
MHASYYTLWMGTARSLYKDKAMRMRLRGMSYNEIMRKLPIPSKGTLSFWLQNLELPPQALTRLKTRSEAASKKNLARFNTARAQRIKIENEEQYTRGHESIGHVPGRELLIIGAALYWGEGTKSDGRGTHPVLAFANSDAAMVRVYMQFLRKILKEDEPRIRGGIHLYPSTNIQKARLFWAKVTRLPADRFYISTMVIKSSAGKRSHKLLPHGTVTIRVNNRQLFHRMRGMLAGLAHSKLA